MQPSVRRGSAGHVQLAVLAAQVAVPLISALVALLSEAIMPRQLQSDAASAEAEAEAEADLQLAMTARSMLVALLDASSGADVDVLSTSLARQPSGLPQVA